MLSSPDIANKIKIVLHQNGNKAITFSWEQFYALTNRVKLCELFLDEIKLELKKNDILIIYGKNTVIVVRDFYWSPVSF